MGPQKDFFGIQRNLCEDMERLIGLGWDVYNRQGALGGGYEEQGVMGEREGFIGQGMGYGIGRCYDGQERYYRIRERSEAWLGQIIGWGLWG